MMGSIHRESGWAFKFSELPSRTYVPSATLGADDSRGRRKKPQLTQISRHRSPSTVRCFAKYNLITSSIRIRIRKERERDEPASLVVAHKRFPFHNVLGQSSVIGTAFLNQVCEIVIITSTRNNQWPYQLLDSLPSGNMTMPASQPTDKGFPNSFAQAILNTPFSITAP